MGRCDELADLVFGDGIGSHDLVAHSCCKEDAHDPGVGGSPLEAAALRAVEAIGAFVFRRAQLEDEIGRPFPQDTAQQLWGAIGAVFSSWMNARAITYRRLR